MLAYRDDKKFSLHETKNKISKMILGKNDMINSIFNLSIAKSNQFLESHWVILPRNRT